jgi:hypothetical protein
MPCPPAASQVCGAAGAAMRCRPRGAGSYPRTAELTLTRKSATKRKLPQPALWPRYSTGLEHCSLPVCTAAVRRDLTELHGWSSPQVRDRYGASARARSCAWLCPKSMKRRAWCEDENCASCRGNETARHGEHLFLVEVAPFNARLEGVIRVYCGGSGVSSTRREVSG